MFQRVIIGVIEFYQRAISPYTLPSCRFFPTCSEYSLRAVQRHGPTRGGWLALRRILRCRPFGGRGHDPVPDLEVARLNRGGSEV